MASVQSFLNLLVIDGILDGSETDANQIVINTEVQRVWLIANGVPEASSWTEEQVNKANTQTKGFYLIAKYRTALAMRDLDLEINV